jgi:hypothetical protein
MLSSDRPEQTADEGVLSDAKPACVALVPVVASARWAIPSRLSRPDSIFLTHLIATAEQVPQAGSSRRATLADAQSAYTANRQVRGAGVRTRHII